MEARGEIIRSTRARYRGPRVVRFVAFCLLIFSRCFWWGRGGRVHNTSVERARAETPNVRTRAHSGRRWWWRPNAERKYLIVPSPRPIRHRHVSSAIGPPTGSGRGEIIFPRASAGRRPTKTPVNSVRPVIYIVDDETESPKPRRYYASIASWLTVGIDPNGDNDRQSPSVSAFYRMFTPITREFGTVPENRSGRDGKFRHTRVEWSIQWYTPAARMFRRKRTPSACFRHFRHARVYL